MKRRFRLTPVIAAIVAVSGIVCSLGYAAENEEEMVVKYILETVKAIRTVYSKGVIDQVKKAGVKPSENWKADDHTIMLNAQFVKAVGAEIKDFELGLIGLTPIYKSNLPKTKVETDALQRMMDNPELKVLTFADGNQFKGLAADHAISQTCVDCHNAHPSSPKKNFRQGDLMGAIVVRINK
jgi:hypothetical protein